MAAGAGSGGSGSAGGGGSGGSAQRVVIQAPRLGKPFDPEEERERTRKRLAMLLAAVVVTVALLLVVLTATGGLKIGESKELAGFVLSPLIGVTGTALGFYFGGHRGGKSGE